MFVLGIMTEFCYIIFYWILPMFSGGSGKVGVGKNLRDVSNWSWKKPLDMKVRTIWWLTSAVIERNRNRLISVSYKKSAAFVLHTLKSKNQCRISKFEQFLRIGVHKNVFKSSSLSKKHILSQISQFAFLKSLKWEHILLQMPKKYGANYKGILLKKDDSQISSRNIEKSQW